MTVDQNDYATTVCCLSSTANKAEVHTRDQKIELCKKELGTKYLLHPSNFIKHKDGRQS